MAPWSPGFHHSRYSKFVQASGSTSYFQLTPIRKPALERKFNQLREAGVVMLIDADNGIPMKFHSQSTCKEFNVWVNEFGVDPMLAIKAATYWPCKMMKVDNDYGTVSEGKYADIIAVKGDVLRHIALLSDVDFVMKHGKVVKNKKCNCNKRINDDKDENVFPIHTNPRYDNRV